MEGPSAAANEHRELWWESPASQLGRVARLALPPEGFVAEQGGALPGIQVSYECWGELNAARDNAVLVIHPLALDLHASGQYAGQPPGWWEGLIGPGRALDTERSFVVCPNLLGGCYGATGPRFPAPDGAPYLDRFPLLTPRDMVRALRLFVRALGIERLALVIGPSMGGMLAWEWAIEGGDEVEEVAVVAAPLRTTPLQIGWNWLQRRGIELDITGPEASAAWGQMVARGLGMLTYRSPIGLEEKFGREWFTPPGATVGERGMFNVESWLRHQGRRSVKRFDPWTYLLFSRAMDLHDVSRGRGSLVTALEPVRARMLVVGISSDYLYPPEEVHLGADILNHLGKRVEYEEIRSPHGHDAFLLETAQLGEILRQAHRRGPRRVPTPGERAVRRIRLGILGAGRVSRLFCRLLEERSEEIVEEYGLRFETAAVADPDPAQLEDPAFAGMDRLCCPAELVRRADVDVVVEVTRRSDTSGLIKEALSLRRPVVTSNKALVRRHGARLEALALANGVRLAYHGGIAAGWPLIYAVERPLGRGEIRRIEAVLSSTCNSILERMEQGATLHAALAEAQSAGLTEPDPDLDVSGWDSAQKLLILACRAEGARFGMEDLDVRGLTGLDSVVVREAPSLGLRVKLVGFFRREPGGLVAGVLPAGVLAEGHLGGVRGDSNVVVLWGEETGELVYLGRGSGRMPVAHALLNDLLGLFHPAKSWTGRFPRAVARLEPPRFGAFLVRDGEGVAISRSPAEGGVPLLESLVLPG